MTNSTQPVSKHSTFAEDVSKGLSSSPKSLSSKYFYDDEGSRLFQEIMKLPEYYLSRAELEVFTDCSAEIFQRFSDGVKEFDLIELGAGDGTKTAVLISHFLRQKFNFTYSPIDISQEALDHLTAGFSTKFPELSVKPMHGDYFRTLESLCTDSSRRKVILFLGSNVGNFTREQSIGFFRSLRRVMNGSDLLFIGFDLQKDPRVIVDAYDDSQGVTAEFNLNLLRRINRELGGNFELDKFSHYAIYRPIEGAARSFLISREKQTVHIEALKRDFEFEQWEAIFMEISQKYTLRMIADLAEESGFQVTENFFDSRRYYTNSLWRPV